MENYDLIIGRIVSLSGLSKEEVEEKVEEKKKKLSGLISREGAAQIIAAELGISFEDQKIKISELKPGMKKVNLIGKITNLFPVREFSKEGRSGKVSNFIVSDETGSTKIVLWDVNHISLIENEDVKKGDVIEVKNGSFRESEIHLSSFSEFKKSEEKIENVKESELQGGNFSLAENVSLDNVRNSQNVRVLGTVVQIFQPRFYKVCSECFRKVLQKEEGYHCNDHGKVSPKERAILNFVLDDGFDNIRVVMFSNQINDLIPEDDLKDPSKAISFRDDFLGKEIEIKGIVKRNQLFNNLEIVANNVSFVDVESLIKERE